jgi:hypothetical protein
MLICYKESKISKDYGIATYYSLLFLASTPSSRIFRSLLLDLVSTLKKNITSNDEYQTEMDAENNRQHHCSIILDICDDCRQAE